MDWQFTLALAVCNVIRLSKQLVALAWMPKPGTGQLGKAWARHTCVRGAEACRAADQTYSTGPSASGRQPGIAAPSRRLLSMPA